MRYTLKKAEILRGKKNFDVIFTRGKRAEGRYLRGLFVLNAPHSKSSETPCVVGFAVARTVRRAVDRNRLKRFLRESYRRNKSILHPMIERLPTPLVLVFLYTKGAAHVSDLPEFSEIESDMKNILGEIAATRLGT